MPSKILTPEQVERVPISVPPSLQVEVLQESHEALRSECDDLKTQVASTLGQLRATEHHALEMGAEIDNLKRQLAEAYLVRDGAMLEQGLAYGERENALTQLQYAQADNAALRDALSPLVAEAITVLEHLRYEILPDKLRAALSHPGQSLLDAHKAEVERLTADNAALLEALKNHGDWDHGEDCDYYEDEDDCTCGAVRLNLAKHRVLEQLHPGQALLLEIEATNEAHMQARSLVEKHWKSLAEARNELEAARKVVEAARWFDVTDCTCYPQCRIDGILATVKAFDAAKRGR